LISAYFVGEGVAAVASIAPLWRLGVIIVFANLVAAVAWNYFVWQFTV
jgi:hypothetical protein